MLLFWKNPGRAGKTRVANDGLRGACRHGGAQVSKYLKGHLHALIENSKEEDVPVVIRAYRALGGYLRRYRGGPLSRFRDPPDVEHGRQGIGLDELAVVAFLKASSSPAFTFLSVYSNLPGPLGRSRGPRRRLRRESRLRRHRRPPPLTRHPPFRPLLRLLPHLPHHRPRRRYPRPPRLYLLRPRQSPDGEPPPRLAHRERAAPPERDGHRHGLVRRVEMGRDAGEYERGGGSGVQDARGDSGARRAFGGHQG